MNPPAYRQHFPSFHVSNSHANSDTHKAVKEKKIRLCSAGRKMRAVFIIRLIPAQMAYLRNFEEPQQVGHLDGCDGRRGSHHTRNDLVPDFRRGSVLAFVFRVVDGVAYRAWWGGTNQ